MKVKEMKKMLNNIPEDCRIDFMLCPIQDTDDERDDINLNCIGEIYSYNEELNFIEIGLKCDVANTSVRHCGELEPNNYINNQRRK